MNLSLPFIERPVMTTLVMAALVIFGGYGYASLPWVGLVTAAAALALAVWSRTQAKSS